MCGILKFIRDTGGQKASRVCGRRQDNGSHPEEKPPVRAPFAFCAEVTRVMPGRPASSYLERLQIGQLRGRLHLSPHPAPERLERGVDRWHNNQRKEERKEQPADDGGTHRPPELRVL